MNTNEPIYVTDRRAVWLGNGRWTIGRYCFTPSMCVAFRTEPEGENAAGAVIEVGVDPECVGGREGLTDRYWFPPHELEVYHSRSLVDVMVEVIRGGDHALIPIPQNLIRSAA